MRLTAKVKLQPSMEQHVQLLRTLEEANAACNHISQRAWDEQTFKQFPIHRLTYREVRNQFGLSAQMVVRCIAKVADSYKVDRDTMRVFKPHGAIAYDSRILRWLVDEQEVSIWAIGGRQPISFVCGERQLELLQAQRGESDLCYIGGEFYLFATCDVEPLEPVDVEGFLGVDLGIVNIAVDCDNNTYAGNHINRMRERYARQRAQLQAKGTKSARRKLKQLSGAEARFRHDVNHRIAKRLVQLAKDTGRGIALEDLSGIRDRATVRKSQRRLHHSWAFYDLRKKIEYKAELAGIPVVLVDPRNTSRTCPVCGCVDKRSRKSQAEFSCIRCGYSAPADYIAARNIARRAAVTQPAVCSDRFAEQFAAD